MPTITASFDPSSEILTVCVVPLPPGGVAYITVILYNADAQIVFAKSFRITEPDHCVEMKPPSTWHSGFAEDIDGVMDDCPIVR